MKGRQRSSFTLCTLLLIVGTGTGRTDSAAEEHALAQASTQKPAPTAITNADIIGMVTAGLSEQVITASIRQAPARKFDLTPASLIELKKAGVPDAVILAMQSIDAPATPASAASAATGPDDKEPVVRAYLTQLVTSQSGGLLSLGNFRKTNGYESGVPGIYSVEWQADVSVLQDVWKGGNNLVGYWGSFAVMTQQPSSMDSLMFASAPKRFNRGTWIRLTGDCMLRNTEQGWRIEKLSVKTSQEIARPVPTVDPPAPILSAATKKPGPTETSPPLPAIIDRAAFFEGKAQTVAIQYRRTAEDTAPLDGRLTLSRNRVSLQGATATDSFDATSKQIRLATSLPGGVVRLRVVVKPAGSAETEADYYFPNQGDMSLLVFLQGIMSRKAA